MNTTVCSNPLLLHPCRMPPRTLKPSDKVGYFRPQLGFTPSDQSRTYSTPRNVQRFISSSLSDPKSYRQPPQGHSSQHLSWQPFEESRPAPQRAWSMQAPPHPHPNYPAYSGGGRGGFGGQPPRDQHRSNGECPLYYVHALLVTRSQSPPPPPLSVHCTTAKHITVFPVLCRAGG